MTSRSESGCVRGCVQEGVHFATCSVYDPAHAEDAAPCRGCAPASRHADSPLCEDCYRRLRRLLRDAGDLLGRLESLTEQGKAVVYQPVKRSSSTVVARDQVDGELLEAIAAVRARVDRWSAWIVIRDRSLRGLDVVLSDDELTWALLEDVVEQHPADEDGHRYWSIADAAARWGVERRDPHRFVFPAGSSRDGVVERAPVTEWYDPLLTIQQAAKRARRDQRTVQRWIEAGDLKVEMHVRLPDNTMIRAVRAKAVDDLAKRKAPGRPPRSRELDTPA